MMLNSEKDTYIYINMYRKERKTDREEKEGERQRDGEREGQRQRRIGCV